jgi:hypothetical protein
MMVCVAALLIVPGVAAWSTGCLPPNVTYDLGSAGGPASSTSSSGTCAGTNGTGGGCGLGSVGGVIGDFTNTADWGSFDNLPHAGITLQDGKVVITTDGYPSAYSAAYLKTNVSLTGCRIFVHAAPPLMDHLYTAYISLDTGTEIIEIVKVAGALQMEILDDKTMTMGPLNDIPYDPVKHAWWQIREAGGMVHFETSSDGCTWTQRESYATPPMDAGVGIALGFGIPGPAPPPDAGPDTWLPPDQVTFDHLNVLP